MKTKDKGGLSREKQIKKIILKWWGDQPLNRTQRPITDLLKEVGEVLNGKKNE